MEGAEHLFRRTRPIFVVHFCLVAFATTCKPFKLGEVCHPMICSMSLRAYARDYDDDHATAVTTRKLRIYAITSLERHLGREATTADVVPQTLNPWINAMLAGGELVPETARCYRRAILSLAICAHGDEAKKTRKVKVQKKLPQSWSQKDLAALLKAAEKFKRPMRYHPSVLWSDVLVAIVYVGYQTGLRLGDLLEFSLDQIDDSGVMVLIQRKTGNVVRCQLDDDGRRAVDAIASPHRKRIFGSLAKRSTLQEKFSALCRAAGVSGSIKRLRATGATWVEAVHPGAAMRFLGHATPGLAYKHYVDPRFLIGEQPRPPRLHPEL